MKSSVIMSPMDEDHPSYDLRAPASEGSGSPMHLPGRGFPRVDDHLVQPEVTRDEVIGGRRVVAHPAAPPHAFQHARPPHAAHASLAPGHAPAPALLTRPHANADFA